MGLSLITVGPAHLEHLGSREQLTLGPLSGYAVAYRLVAGSLDAKKTFADALAQENRSLLVLSLTDGCVWFETTLLVASSDKDEVMAIVELLLLESTVQELPGWAAGPTPRGSYSAVVRPRQLPRLELPELD